ncbi:MAG: hypothetical protein AB7E76_02710 [Deferribacterales bacterium]
MAKRELQIELLVNEGAKQDLIIAIQSTAKVINRIESKEQVATLSQEAEELFTKLFESLLDIRDGFIKLGNGL